MEMTTVESDLKAISVFIPRFFASLSAVVAALPILDRFLDVLPPIIMHRDLASFLASIVAFALIGGDFISRLRTRSEKLRVQIDNIGHGKKNTKTGNLFLIFGVALTVGFIGFSDFVNSMDLHPPWYIELIAIFWYLCIYGLIAKGFWQMSFTAYARRNLSLDTEIPAREIQGHG